MFKVKSLNKLFPSSYFQLFIVRNQNNFISFGWFFFLMSYSLYFWAFLAVLYQFLRWHMSLTLFLALVWKISTKILTLTKSLDKFIFTELILVKRILVKWPKIHFLQQGLVKNEFSAELRDRLLTRTSFKHLDPTVL